MADDELTGRFLRYVITLRPIADQSPIMPKKLELPRPWTTRWVTGLILAPTALLFFDGTILAGILSLSALSDLVLGRLFPKRSGHETPGSVPADDLKGTGKVKSAGAEALHEPGRPSASKWDPLAGAILLLLWVFCAVTVENPGKNPFGQRLFWFVFIGLPPLVAGSTRMIARWLFRWRSRSEPMSVFDLLDSGGCGWFFLLLPLYPIAASPRGLRHAVPLFLFTLFFAGNHAMVVFGSVVSPTPGGTIEGVMVLGSVVLLIIAGSCWVTLPEHNSLPSPQTRRAAPRKRASKTS
jgi:hypothetical protein